MSQSWLQEGCLIEFVPVHQKSVCIWHWRCIAPHLAAFTDAARILLYFSGSFKLYITVFCHHGPSNVWNNVVCAFHSSGVLFWIISSSYFTTNPFVWWWAMLTFGPSVRPQRSSTRASACGPTNSVYNGGLLGEAAELTGWYVNVIPPPTTTLPKAKMTTISTRAALRSAARDLVLPRTRRRLDNRAFCIAGPAACNRLPSDIRTASTLST